MCARPPGVRLGELPDLSGDEKDSVMLDGDGDGAVTGGGGGGGEGGGVGGGDEPGGDEPGGEGGSEGICAVGRVT